MVVEGRQMAMVGMREGKKIGSGGSRWREKRERERELVIEQMSV